MEKDNYSFNIREIIKDYENLLETNEYQVKELFKFIDNLNIGIKKELLISKLNYAIWQYVVTKDYENYNKSKHEGYDATILVNVADKLVIDNFSNYKNLNISKIHAGTLFFGFVEFEESTINRVTFEELSIHNLLTIYGIVISLFSKKDVYNSKRNKINEVIEILKADYAYLYKDFNENKMFTGVALKTAMNNTHKILLPKLTSLIYIYINHDLPVANTEYNVNFDLLGNQWYIGDKKIRNISIKDSTTGFIQFYNYEKLILQLASCEELLSIYYNVLTLINMDIWKNY
jgi:hypothetical protein